MQGGGEKRSWAELHLFYVALLLYTAEGVILGLSFGSLPVLLHKRVAINELGLLTVVMYPQMLRDFLGPLIQTVVRGTKKGTFSCLWLLSAVLIFFADRTEDAMEHGHIAELILIFLVLVAVATAMNVFTESWLETLRTDPPQFRSLGLNVGSFVSFVVFLLLQDPLTLVHSFGGHRIETVKHTAAIVRLSDLMTGLGIMTLVVAMNLILIPNGDPSPERIRRRGISELFADVKNVRKTACVRGLMYLLVLQRLPFITFEFIAQFKLLEKGLPLEMLAAVRLMDFVPGILSGMVAVYWIQDRYRKTVWIYSFYFRIVFGLLITYFISQLPSKLVFPADLGSIGVYVGLAFLSVFSGNLMFVSQSQLIDSLEDFRGLDGEERSARRRVLNGMSQIGSCLPRVLFYWATDLASARVCFRQQQSFVDVPCPLSAPFGTPSNNLCTDSGGECLVVSDGFYSVSYFSLLGAITMGIYFGRTLRHLPAQKTKQF